MLPESFDPNVFSNGEMPRSQPKSRVFAASFAALFCVLFAAFFFEASAPSSFPLNEEFTVQQGWTLSQTADALASRGVIRSALLFKSFSVFFGTARNISATSYAFPEKESVWRVAWDLGHAAHIAPDEKITVIEGMTNADIAKLMDDRFPLFSAAEFKRLAKGKEGYLFPDTYFFGSGATASSVIAVMSDTFAKRTADAEKEAAAKQIPFSDVVKMASIIEKEANDKESMSIVSGILWKRIKLGMPLQADATLTYVTGKGTKDLTESDLASKSPYNSYTNAGLPPTPIANPGLNAIEAAIHPEKTNYLYFLTDNRGKMHYAVTLEDHAANKAKYLP